MFSCEICEIFKNIYFEEHLRTTASKHRSSFLDVFCRRCRSALMLWWNIAFLKYNFLIELFCRNMVEFKVGECYMQIYKELHFITGIFQRISRCRTAILKNASWWLLPRTNLFWKHSYMATSQSNCKHIFILEIFTHTLHFLLWRHVKEERIFMIFFSVKVLAKSVSTQN